LPRGPEPMDEQEAHERAEVISRLRAYDAQIAALMTLVRQYIDSPGPEHGRVAKDRARRLLGELKARLKGDDARSRRASGPGAEAAVFRPAVQGAVAAIRVGSNSFPDEKWYGQLHEAQGEIQYHLRRLEGPGGPGGDKG
jgi:hypothetical protein